MRLNCGPSKAARRQAKKQKMEQWHDYFCWLPVRLAENDCRWLETIQRKYDYWYPHTGGFYPEYREIK